MRSTTLQVREQRASADRQVTENDWFPKSNTFRNDRNALQRLVFPVLLPGQRLGETLQWSSSPPKRQILRQIPVGPVSRKMTVRTAPRATCCLRYHNKHSQTASGPELQDSARENNQAGGAVDVGRLRRAREKDSFSRYCSRLQYCTF